MHCSSLAIVVHHQFLDTQFSQKQYSVLLFFCYCEFIKGIRQSSDNQYQRWQTVGRSGSGIRKQVPADRSTRQFQSSNNCDKVHLPGSLVSSQQSLHYMQSLSCPIGHSSRRTCMFGCSPFEIEREWLLLFGNSILKQYLPNCATKWEDEDKLMQAFRCLCCFSLGIWNGRSCVTMTCD